MHFKNISSSIKLKKKIKNFRLDTAFYIFPGYKRRKQKNGDYTEDEPYGINAGQIRKEKRPYDAAQVEIGLVYRISGYHILHIHRFGYPHGSNGKNKRVRYSEYY